MITAIIVDDEEPAREELRYLLEQDLDFAILGEAADGSEAFEKIRSLQPQVLFLDVQMPELDGFGLAELLIQQGKPPLIVFTTAYDQYAVKAFEHAALDYLLKPIRLERLQQTLKRIKESLLNTQATDWQHQMEEFVSNLKKPVKLDRLPVLANEKVILLEPNEIIYVESEGRGTKVVTAQSIYTSDYSLSELEDKLKDFFFFKTHRSYLVNLKEIREVIPWFNNTLVLKLKGCSQEIPVSRTFIKEFKQHISI